MYLVWSLVESSLTVNQVKPRNTTKDYEYQHAKSVKMRSFLLSTVDPVGSTAPSRAVQ